MSARRKFFSAAEVKAIREGKKTQFRLPSTIERIDFQDHFNVPKTDGVNFLSWFVKFSQPTGLQKHISTCSGSFITREQALSYLARTYGPYKPGDLLWVPETWRLFNSQNECACYDDCQCARMHGKLIYRADFADAESDWESPARMRQGYARTYLSITDVRAERLNGISEADAMAEGVLPILVPPDGGSAPHVAGFENAWESKNGPGSFNDDWVFAFTFEVMAK